MNENEKKPLTISFPGIPFFISTDPDAVDENGRKPDLVIEDWRKYRHLPGADRPNFRPPPRPKPPEQPPEAEPKHE